MTGHSFGNPASLPLEPLPDTRCPDPRIFRPTASPSHPTSHGSTSSIAASLTAAPRISAASTSATGNYRRPHLRGYLRPRLYGRPSHGCRRQRLVQHGLGGSGGRRRALLRARRRLDCENLFAGKLRELLFRRQERRSALHDGQHIRLFTLCEYDGRSAAMKRR
jgi:hypothetical protein